MLKIEYCLFCMLHRKKDHNSHLLTRDLEGSYAIKLGLVTKLGWKYGFMKKLRTLL